MGVGVDQTDTRFAGVGNYQPLAIRTLSEEVRIDADGNRSDNPVSPAIPHCQTISGEVGDVAKTTIGTQRRQMRAEEKAHRLPVLISIPLVACMLPTMIGTLMLPAVVMVVRKIFPLMAGG